MCVGPHPRCVQDCVTEKNKELQTNLPGRGNKLFIYLCRRAHADTQAGTALKDIFVAEDKLHPC